MPAAAIAAISTAASYAASVGAISTVAGFVMQTPLVIGSMPLTAFNTPHAAKELTNVDRQPVD